MSPWFRLAFTLGILLGGCMPPAWGTHALLHPARRAIAEVPKVPFEEVTAEGDGVTLSGWRIRAEQQPPRGVVVYLHGHGDNRQSVLGLVSNLRPRGYDVVAFDHRAHGRSTGQACTYGVYEKRDTKRVLDTIAERPLFLFGVSLGAAIALQTAAEDSRIAGVVSVAAFSDLAIVARERAPFFASRGQIAEALAMAEREAGFKVTDASPLQAARRIAMPVLLLHGDADDETPPDHSRRIYAALTGSKDLMLVRGARHGDVLRKEAWEKIVGFLRGMTPSVD